MNAQAQKQKVKQVQGRERRIRKSLTADQRAALARVQEAVFVLAPRQLKGLAEVLDPEGTGEWEGEQADSSELLDDPDCELEDWDDDELTDHLESVGAVVSLASGVDVVENPIVDPGDVYALHCSRGRCFYEPPSWMLRMRDTAFGRTVGKSLGFVTQLAKWLEVEKSGFLENPTPVEYVRNETVFEFPVVTQDGLREILIQGMPTGSGIDKTRFSRLSDKIWLFWPDRVMPLRSLFSLEFRRAWVVRGCLLGKNFRQMKSVYRSIVNKEMAVSKKRRELKHASFASMDPIERLIYLCGKVKLGTKDGLEAVLTELESKK